MFLFNRNKNRHNIRDESGKFSATSGDGTGLRIDKKVEAETKAISSVAQIMKDITEMQIQQEALIESRINNRNNAIEQQAQLIADSMTPEEGGDESDSFDKMLLQMFAPIIAAKMSGQQSGQPPNGQTPPDIPQLEKTTKPATIDPITELNSTLKQIADADEKYFSKATIKLICKTKGINEKDLKNAAIKISKVY